MITKICKKKKRVPRLCTHRQEGNIKMELKEVECEGAGFIWLKIGSRGRL
jgi:hypothetical protein